MERSRGDHNKVIRDAAREFLGPMGLDQKGRSRTWLDDRTWHLIVVEFQPSSWSRGSYLNVGINWLWWPKDYLSFDYGLAGPQVFITAEADGFLASAQRLAAVAADRVAALRKEAETVHAASDVLTRDPGPGWARLHAGIAAGLAGRAATSARLLDDLGSTRPTRDWEIAMVTRARGLRAMLNDPDRFRCEVVDTIISSRLELKLPERDAAEILRSIE